MLIAAAAAVTRSSLNGREVIVAIIGGTMVTLTLTRPRLRWMEQWARGDRSRRLWTERVLTGFSLVMGSYAAATVWIALYGQFGAEINALLIVAALFLLVYAGLVHFEPFVNEWDLCGGFAAFLLYLAFCLLALITGAAIAEFAISSSLSAVTIAYLAGASAFAALTCLCYRFWRTIDIAVDRFLNSTVGPIIWHFRSRPK
jgi:hypothetical protein